MTKVIQQTNTVKQISPKKVTSWLDGFTREEHSVAEPIRMEVQSRLDEMNHADKLKEEIAVRYRD